MLLYILWHHISQPPHNQLKKEKKIRKTLQICNEYRNKWAFITFQMPASERCLHTYCEEMLRPKRLNFQRTVSNDTNLESLVLTRTPMEKHCSHFGSNMNQINTLISMLHTYTNVSCFSHQTSCIAFYVPDHSNSTFSCPFTCLAQMTRPWQLLLTENMKGGKGIRGWRTDG